MKHMTNEQRDQILAEGNKIMEQLFAEQKSARDVMAEIYVNSLPGKTLDVGYAMADAAIASAESFSNDYLEVQNDVDRYINTFMNKMDEGKTPAERCTYWLRFTAILSTASVQKISEEGTVPDPAITAQKIDTLTVTPEEATPAYEQELRERAIRVLKDSGILLSGLAEQTDSLTGYESESEAAELIVDFGRRDTDLRAILAMLIYTKAKKGELEDFPADITLEQTAAMVCAEIEGVKIMEEVGTGRMTAERATELLAGIGVVVIAAVVLHLAFPGVALAVDALAAALVDFELVAILNAITKFISVIAGNALVFSGACWLWKKASKIIVKVTAVTVKTVVRGATAVAKFAKEHVLAPVAVGCRNVYDFVIRLLFGGDDPGTAGAAAATRVELLTETN